MIIAFYATRSSAQRLFVYNCPQSLGCTLFGFQASDTGLGWPNWIGDAIWRCRSLLLAPCNHLAQLFWMNLGQDWDYHVYLLTYLAELARWYRLLVITLVCASFLMFKVLCWRHLHPRFNVLQLVRHTSLKSCLCTVYINVHTFKHLNLLRAWHREPTSFQAAQHESWGSRETSLSIPSSNSSNCLFPPYTAIIPSFLNASWLWLLGMQHGVLGQGFKKMNTCND